MSRRGRIACEHWHAELGRLQQIQPLRRAVSWQIRGIPSGVGMWSSLESDLTHQIISASNQTQNWQMAQASTSTSKYDPRVHVGLSEERVTDVSSTDFPGHYPDEDHSWDLRKFKKVCKKNYLYCRPRHSTRGAQRHYK